MFSINLELIDKTDKSRALLNYLLDINCDCFTVAYPYSNDAQKESALYFHEQLNSFSLGEKKLKKFDLLSGVTTGPSGVTVIGGWDGFSFYETEEECWQLNDESIEIILKYSRGDLE